MSLLRHNNKRDESEPEIVSALEQYGFSVVRLDKPVDLLVGFRGRCWLIEAKTGAKGYGKGLNDNQVAFAATWNGPEIVILRNQAEALNWAAGIRRHA